MTKFSLLIFRIRSGCVFLLKSFVRKGKHERSVFATYFIREILHDRKYYSAYDDITRITRKLKKHEQILKISDFGAGGEKQFSRKVKDVYKRSVITPKFGKLLFRIAQNFDVKNILELGTSLGLSSVCLAKAKPQAKVITLEGCPELVGFSRSLHTDMEIENIEVVNANFDDELESVLQRSDSIQLFYVDGNHTYKATKRYIKLIQQYSSSQIVIILDDIHWSKGMEQAWNEVVRTQEVRLSIDLFRMGILFYNTDLPKEHLQLWF